MPKFIIKGNEPARPIGGVKPEPKWEEDWEQPVKRTRRIGYARVSTRDQNLDVQLTKLEDAGCTRIFQEKRSGTSINKRAELHRALAALKPGDALVITKLDRLARSITDLLRLMGTLMERNIDLICTDQHIDTSTPAGRLQVHVLAAVAEFETGIRAERQKEGIEMALEKGTRFGGKLVEELKGEQWKERLLYDYHNSRALGLTKAEIPVLYDICRATMYNIVNNTGKYRQA